ncbi:hypothetical protein MKX01_001186 [Papaver californicum]|nr:hypothetical protein MKX01_001186 [Papaver californicum]
MEISSVEQENNFPTHTPESFVSSMPSVAIVEMCSVCMVGAANDQSGTILNNGDNKKEEEEELGKEMPCKHIYHAHCITTWLSRHNTCPLCRCQMITTTVLS